MVTLTLELFVLQSVQSAIQQSSWGPVPSGASHVCGSVPSDHACGDASAAGESGLQFPAEQQQHSGNNRVLALEINAVQFDSVARALHTRNVCSASLIITIELFLYA